MRDDSIVLEVVATTFSVALVEHFGKKVLRDVGLVTVRTNQGVNAARTLATRLMLAAGWTGDELYISCIFEVPSDGPRRRVDRERKRGEAPPDVRTVYDYMFSTVCGQLAILPEKDPTVSLGNTTTAEKRGPWRKCANETNEHVRCPNREARWAGTGLCMTCSVDAIGRLEILKRYHATRRDDGRTWSGVVYGAAT